MVCQSNPAKLFENRFAKDTRPNTLTNNGANSLITLKDFSEIDNRMSFNVEFGDSVVKPLFTNELGSVGKGNSLSVLTDSRNRTFFYVLIDSNLIVTNFDSIINEYNSFSQFKIAGTVQDINKYTSGVKETKLSLVRFLNVFVQDSDFVRITDVGELITAPPVITKRNGNRDEVVLGTSNGRLIFYEISSEFPSVYDTLILNPQFIIRKILVEEDFIAAFSLYRTPEFIFDWIYIDEFGSYDI